MPKHRIAEDSPSSLKNWIEKFQMQCSPKTSFGYFGSVFFIGVALSSLIFPRLSDLIGRKHVAIIGNLLHVFAGKLIFMSDSQMLTFIMCFVQGFGMGGRVFIGFFWMTENMRTSDVPKATTIIFFVDALCIFFASIWFKYISKDWKTFYG